jgi:hypothetical protein
VSALAGVGFWFDFGTGGEAMSDSMAVGKVRRQRETAGSAGQLRELIRTLGVSQVKAAQLVGVDPRTMRRWVSLAPESFSQAPLSAVRLLEVLAAANQVRGGSRTAAPLRGLDGAERRPSDRLGEGNFDASGADHQSSDEFEAAYRRTEFRVADGIRSFVLRDGEASEPLVACHAAFGVVCSAYLTAWNPRSEPRARERNYAAQVRMESELRAAGYPLLRGIGVDPSGQWPGEESVLVLGISDADAARVGRRYGQNAVVVAGRDAVARVVMVERES